MTVRVRFAPSPTGALTVGGLRSSLFNWLFARHHGGVFILRIEDTDRTRLTPGAMQALLDAHRWLGLDWDEGPDVGGPYGPYIQSERLPIYHAAAERLLAQGDAYRCYCTEERLEEMRAAQRRANLPTGYDRRCRTLPPEAALAGAPFVVRFKMPLEGETVLDDPIRGIITWKNAAYDDHVLLKSDGFPTYGLAAIVDDVEMKITHAFRAEEWLPSTPRHLQTYRALGAPPPIYCHLPVVLGKDRKKLSKRHGDTSVQSYAGAGYLPDAMLNFLGLIGWSLDDKTVLLPRAEFVRHFTLDRIVKSPAQFDLDKLNAINQEYIKALPAGDLTELAARWLERDLPPAAPRPVDRVLVARMAEALRTRLTKLEDVTPLTSYLFLPSPLVYDLSLFRGRKGDGDPAEARAMLELLRERLATLEPWEGAAMDALFDELAPKGGAIKKGTLLAPLRIAVTGGSVSLPMDLSLELLGRGQTLVRIDDAIARLA